jgi:hypothetical protein
VRSYDSCLYGDWNKLNAYLNRLTTARGRLNRILGEIGIEIEQRVKSAFESQDFPEAVPPLKEKYLNWKIANGFDERIGFKTGEMVDSLEVSDVKEEGDSLVVFITTTKQDEAIYLEFGTSRQPGRPVWQIVWREMRAEIPEQLISHIRDLILAV